MLAFFSTRELPVTSFSDSHPPTTETAIFVKSQLKKSLFLLPRGANQLSNLVILDLLSLQVGGPAPGAQHRGAHFAFGLGSFKNGTNHGKSPPSEFLIDFKSSEFGTLKTPTFQRSSVQPTIAFSESISNVNISFCT